VSNEPPVVVERTPAPLPSPTDSGVRWAADPARAADEQALGRARQALADEPYSASALRDELAALRRLERWDETVATLEKLIELAPDDPELPFERAGLRLRQRRWVEAAASYREVVARQPQRVAAWFNLAVACHGARRLNDARQAWDRVLALRPADTRARAQRAETLLDLREYAAAADDLRIVLAEQPDDVGAALNLALALERDQQTADALHVIETARGRRPRDVRLLNRAGELCWTLYETDPDGRSELRAAAQRCWRMSLEIDPGQRDVAQRLSETGE
jgi:tetratricopeptide (TPR) repeat protein